jgi:VanZ family protein
VVVLFAPADDVPSDLPPGTDKVVHVVLFAVLTLTGRRAGLGAAALVPSLLAYAVLSEVAQGTLLPGRSADGWDVLADAVGVLLGVVLGRRLRECGRVRGR